MNVIAITGASGYVGRRLIHRLIEHPHVAHIVAIDVRERDDWPDIVTFLPLDVRDSHIEEVLRTHRCTTLVHLAFVVQAIRDTALMYDINVRGSVNVLHAAARAGVRHIVNLSSYTVYGAWPDNPEFLTEDHFPRPYPGHHYAWHKYLVEREADLVSARGGPMVTHLRAAIVVGPHCTNNLGQSLRTAPFLPIFAGSPSRLQLIHEDDLVAALVRAIEQPEPGIFNVGGKAPLPWAQIVRRAGRLGVPLPATVWETIIGLSWHLRLPNSSTPAELSLLRYPLAVDWTKARRAWGWEPQYTTGEAVDTLMKGR